MASGLDSTKTPARPSHESVESTGGQATEVTETPLEHVDHAATEIRETPLQHVDHEAMESAKRAQNRIHYNEGKNPGTQIFTK